VAFSVGSTQKPQDYFELRMQDTVAKSNTAPLDGGPMDGSIAKPQAEVSVNLTVVASRLGSRRSPLIESVIVSLVSFILLRSSG
jgi:hypothetical protein